MNALPESHHRPLFPRGPGLGFRALVLLVISLALIYQDTRGPGLDTTRSTLAFLLTPLVWVAALPGEAAGAAARTRSRAELERENRELQARYLQLAARLQRFEALEAENRHIRELLSSSALVPDRVLIAEIISLNQDPYRNQIVLNKGRRDGVYPGQALIDAHGVLGQIVSVDRTRSTALLVTDPDHGIPVQILRTGMQTIAVGSGNTLGLRLPFLASNADVKVGDMLVSSSLGGRFPAGYPVGSIYELRHVAGEHFMEALVAPAAHPNQSRQVLLVFGSPTPENDDQQSGSQDREPQDGNSQDSAPETSESRTVDPPQARADAPAPPAAGQNTQTPSRAGTSDP